MARLSSWKNLLNLIGEIDVRPIRAEAEEIPVLVIYAADTGTARYLADQLGNDPDRPGEEFSAAIPVNHLNYLDQGSLPVDLSILVLNQAELEQITDQGILAEWQTGGRRALIVLHTPDDLNELGRKIVPPSGNRFIRRVIGDVYDLSFLQEQLAPAALSLLADRSLALARYYPFFRSLVTRQLIQDACTSNAAYSLTTGVAEIIPVVNVPLNVTDMVVLTKAQAFLVYRLGLALGLPLDWQAYLAEFGSVLGSGFLWRQAARSLIGLVPAYGILPKVAIAYAGTYVVGRVVYQWYLTGRHMNREQIGRLYGQAFANGRELARKLIQRRLKGSTQGAEPKLETGQAESKRQPLRVFRKKEPRLEAANARLCAACGKANNADARYCQYCASPLVQTEENAST